MASMMTMIHHLHHWIANVANGAFDTIGVNDANGRNKSPFAPMDHHVSNGAIDANVVIDAIGFHW